LTVEPSRGCCGVSFCWALTSLWLSVGSVVASMIVVGEVRLPLPHWYKIQIISNWS
jgi:hypothetical protein